MRALFIHAPHDVRIGDFHDESTVLGPDDVQLKMAAGGICGSDLHYYHQGGFGVVRIKEPMVLGHEASGFVEKVGANVHHLVPGDLVAINPSSPCGACSPCRQLQLNHCENMRFNGSAMRFPHVQGLFREEVIVRGERAFRIDKAVSAAEAALCEPFSVALHAVKQAGALSDKTVLVSGCGPIGILMIVAARLAGARRIIATDITAHSLTMAHKFGCDEGIDVSNASNVLEAHRTHRGQIDIAFECSGNPDAFSSVLTTLMAKGRMVLVGLGGDCLLPINMVVAKEIEIIGTFRFDSEFGHAADLISRRVVNLRPMISAHYPMKAPVEAFTHASDRSRATKVVLMLTD